MFSKRYIAIRTKMVAPGGEALGGVIGTFRHMIQTEGFFSLYKGLVPSIITRVGTNQNIAVWGCCWCLCRSCHLPFEVVRRQLQLQVQATKLSALATCVKIVEHGGVPALYAGLIPSLLQVLPSASISYFVYEFMKIVLKVE
ncbi:putative mitochondrial adenine nucleotide transporter BTL3 [Vitis vinifera]|uniref:Putative mitochondrial adenine nucleotide transporter BTL3 n=1 Tax=Vitis vinifera TaxID=29760 RepID=A0A438F7Z2_VITVI|nr:putative mitochondrial adenine nucleotide transporter BTL3 [Vitis vinifera]